MGIIEDVLIFLNWCLEQPTIQVLIIIGGFISVILSVIKGPEIIKDIYKKYTDFKHDRLVKKVNKENIHASEYFRKLGEDG